jgi:hypothetical protein
MLRNEKFIREKQSIHNTMKQSRYKDNTFFLSTNLF